MAKPLIDTRVTNIENTRVITGITKGASEVVQGDIPTDFSSKTFTTYKDTEGTSLTVTGTYISVLNTFIDDNFSSTSAGNSAYLRFTTTTTSSDNVTTTSNTPSCTADGLVAAKDPYLHVTYDAATNIIKINFNTTKVIGTTDSMVLSNGTNTFNAIFTNSVDKSEYHIRIIASYVLSTSTLVFTNIVIYPSTGYKDPTDNDYKYTLELPHAFTVTSKELDGDSTETSSVIFSRYACYVATKDDVPEDMETGSILFIGSDS